MPLVTISYKYKEVWRITEWRDGCVYKCVPTGKCIMAANDNYPLDNNYWTLASLSHRGEYRATMKIDLEPLEYFD